MQDLISRTLDWLRLLFAPGTGKRRRRPHRSPLSHLNLTLVRCPLTTEPPHLPAHRSPYGLAALLDGTEPALVRPYLTAHEREAPLQQRRRLALALAADFGMDQHVIGALEGAA
ncbi:hypothetical protein [Streptomyces shenzhenensis]|uniref:hypothetical protein n=1 Tax=Streptomyces shenzhenensis TaxID=943815 RepID=UPI0015F04393|nr:hypothetical protein [Streptomyces shenzhenensis]